MSNGGIQLCMIYIYIIYIYNYIYILLLLLLLTLLAFTIPKFGHYFLNFYTAYRLRYRVERGIKL